MWNKFHIQPLKMDLTEGSETSAKYNLTPRKYPKEHIQYSKYDESLKSDYDSSLTVIINTQATNHVKISLVY
jgi:hypothetical protein